MLTSGSYYEGQTPLVLWCSSRSVIEVVKRVTTSQKRNQILNSRGLSGSGQDRRLGISYRRNRYLGPANSGPGHWSRGFGQSGLQQQAKKTRPVAGGKSRVRGGTLRRRKEALTSGSSISPQAPPVCGIAHVHAKLSAYIVTTYREMCSGICCATNTVCRLLH